MIYLFDDRDTGKRIAATELVENGIRKATGQISFQVVQETLDVVTGKLGASPEHTMEFLDTVLLPLWRIQPTTEIYKKSIEIRARYKFSFYDCLILPAALESGCSTLYTEDMQHEQQIDRLIVVNPFLDVKMIHDR